MTPPKRISVPNTETRYVGLSGGDATLLGVQIAWLDATTDASLTIQTSYYSADQAPVDVAGQAWHWVDEPIPLDEPDGTAAGGTMAHLGNLGALRVRLRIEANANAEFEILPVAKKQ